MRSQSGGVSVQNKKIIPINFINLAVIVTIMAVVAVLTQNIINDLTLEDIRNVTRLTHTNMYSEIRDELVEPINTSMIMAQNVIVHDFMNEDTEETEDRIARYLSAIQTATGYESVFLVPHETLSYYHPGGTDAKVELGTPAAFWYEPLMVLEEDYAIEVNTEQLDDFALTVYVNAIMRDPSGAYAGVTGVGTRITHLQDILSRYEENQEVGAYLVNEEGLILVHPNLDLIKEETVFSQENIAPELLAIATSQEGLLEKQLNKKYFTVQYLPMLDWYLVVTKSTSQFTTALNQYTIQMFGALVVAACIMMIATNFAITRYKKQIIRLSNTDQLTTVPNRTIFESTLKKAVQNRDRVHFTLALFDLDNLKTINDQLGHDRGDDALKAVAKIAMAHFKEPHVLSRIGGDEFAVIQYATLEESILALDAFHHEIQRDPTLNEVGTTISIGVTEAQGKDTEASVFKRADDALYRSKEGGKNQVEVHDDI